MPDLPCEWNDDADFCLTCGTSIKDACPYSQKMQDIVNLDCAASEVYAKCWSRIAAVLFGEKEWL